MEEIWKPVVGYEGLYEVSNLGRIKSFRRKTPRILKPYAIDGGYLIIGFRNCGTYKHFLVHRLVAEAFIPNPENKPEVNHINGIKTDCRVENLAWVTELENMRHAADTGLLRLGEKCFHAKLTNEQVRYIRENPDNLSIKQLAEMFGVDETSIGKIQLGKTYKTAGGKIRESKRKRISDEIKEQIRAEYQAGVPGHGLPALAKKYGIGVTTVWQIVHEVRK